MRFLSHFLVLTACILGMNAVAYAEKAPKIKNTDFTAVQHPYNDPEKASSDIERAFAEASKTNRLVLIDFGANWCPDCRVLAGIFENPQAAKWIRQHFVLTTVNVDHLDNDNMERARQLGGEIHYIPTVMALTSDKKLLNKDDLLALGDARKMSVQQVVNLLQKWLDRSKEENPKTSP